LHLPQIKSVVLSTKVNLSSLSANAILEDGVYSVFRLVSLEFAGKIKLECQRPDQP
jgi:hypothetical protein